MAGQLTPFVVVSRAYSYTDVIDFWIGGPRYDDGRDYAVVMAANKRDARGKGVRAFYQQNKKHFHKGVFDEGACPFRGMSVEPADAETLEDAKDSGYFYDFSEVTP